jgi:uncharacterized protein YPO0396
VSRVDDLYKQLVLDTPATFDAADLAIRHFADLEAAYEEMTAAADKAAALEPIEGLWDDHTSGLREMARIDGLGLDRAESPMAHWAAKFEASRVDSAMEANRIDHETQAGIASTAKNDEKEYGDLVELYDRQIAEAGGAELTSLDEQITRLEVELANARGERAEFDEATAPLDLTISSEVEFAASRRSAQAFVEVDYERRKNEIDQRRADVQRRVWELEAEQKALIGERDSLRGRAGQVPQDWHEARLEAARAAGLPPDALPFVAELIDIAPAETDWRTAIEVTLRPVARLMLVDHAHLHRLSEAIEQFSWRTRISFEGVDPQPFTPLPLNPAMLSGKLVFKDSPFSAWIQGRVVAENMDALCVDGPRQLDGPGRRVTRSGQLRHGRRGAHGGRQRPIIGFDNKARLDTIKMSLNDLDTQIGPLQEQQEGLAGEAAQLLILRDAHQAVLGAKWADIDHEAIGDQIGRAQHRKASILEANGDLQRLESDRDTATGCRDSARKDRFGAEHTIDLLDEAHARLESRREALSGQVARLEATAQASTTEQGASLSARFADVASIAGYDPQDFTKSLARLVGLLRVDRDQAKRSMERASGALERVFAGFLQRWPDPNLGVSVESYPDFVRIRDEIISTGLHERRHEWVRRLTEWTGEDLVPLNGAFDTAVDNIADRLAPVNKILASLPFGAHRDSLRIDLCKISRDDQVAFRRELRELSSGATETPTVAQAEARFARIQAFIAQIREPEPGQKTDRLERLDVRRHIELSASVVQPDESIRAVFTSLGEKSGGETQELVAFIVGAALRFQLGDETNTWPRFAPVFLDEGFVKADSEFAGRGVNAWKGLGFQLIVAAPPDKVTALERHVDQILSVVKNDSGHARVYEHVEPVSR